MFSFAAWVGVPLGYTLVAFVVHYFTIDAARLPPGALNVGLWASVLLALVVTGLVLIWTGPTQRRGVQSIAYLIVMPLILTFLHGVVACAFGNCF